MNNPFQLPKDEEVFALRDEEAERKRLEREVAKTQHVWEKGVKKNTMKELLASSGELGEDAAKQPSRLTMVAGGGARERGRKENENMADFISKKREMFLVQMSLDTKRAEIRKLEERAQQREEALRKSEQMLEEDALRFDQFLKDNDQKAVQAIKKAEAETKAKAEKVQEIKKLNMQITQIKSEMSKFEEQLEDCRKYKDFLDKLTPQEWFDEMEQQRQQRRRARKETKLEARQQELNEQAERARKEATLKLEAERAKRGRRSRKEREAEEAADAAKVQSMVARQLTLDDVSDDEEPEEEKEVPMYFKEPQQLLDIFTALEESNLFLIQNSQETEATLEELKTKFTETTERMNHDARALAVQIEALGVSIKKEEEKGQALDARAGKHQGVAAQERTLLELNQKVAEVYRAIFSEAVRGRRRQWPARHARGAAACFGIGAAARGTHQPARTCRRRPRAREGRATAGAARTSEGVARASLGGVGWGRDAAHACMWMRMRRRHPSPTVCARARRAACVGPAGQLAFDPADADQHRGASGGLALDHRVHAARESRGG